MAIDKRLQIYDEQGNLVDYDILASDVKFLPDGKDLPTKLAEMQDEIGEGGYTPPQGGIPKTDLAPSVQTSLDKADSAYQKPASGIPASDIADGVIPDVSGLATKTELAGKVDKETGMGLSTNDYTTAEKTKLGNLPTATELATQMNAKANDNAVVKTISVNGGTPATPVNGNVNISVEGAAGEDGITPHIGSNGNWWVGPETDSTNDTGIKAQGPMGSVTITDGDIDTLEVHNALNANTGILGMGGAMCIKSNIDSLYTSLNRLYTKLANMAFWDSEDQEDAAPTPVDWSVPQITVTLDKTNLSANAMITDASDQEITGTSVSVDEGSGLTLKIKPRPGYAITGSPSATIGGVSQTLTESNGVYTLVLDSVTEAITIAISATAVAARSVTPILTGCTMVSGQTSIINGGGGTFVFAANEGYTLPTVAPTVNNATMTSWDSSTGTLVISNVEGNVTITVTAIEQLTDGFYIFLGKSINQNGVPVTDAVSCYTDFIELDQLSSAYSAMWAYQLPADSSDEFTHIKEKRNLVFYDSNKRMMFYDTKWDAKRHPYNFTQNSNNIRELTIAQVSSTLSAAGQNTPVYARISFGMADNTIANACGFTQNGRNYADKTKAHVANFSEAVHNLTFSLTNCTTTATGNQDKVLSGQPVELLFSPSGSGSLNNFSVSATMGGVTVSPSNISIGNYTDADGNSNYKKIVIENVTGDLVITASM